MGTLIDWVKGVFANKYLGAVTAPVTKTIGFFDGYKTQIATVGGGLTALAAVVARSQQLLANGLQYSDITTIAATPEWATLVLCAGLLFNRLGTKKLEAKLEAPAASGVVPQ